MYNKHFGEPDILERIVVVFFSFFILSFILMSLPDDINYIYLHLDYFNDGSNYKIEEYVIEDFEGSVHKISYKIAVFTVNGNTVRCGGFPGDEIGDSILLLVRNDGKFTRYNFGVYADDITNWGCVFAILIIIVIYKKKSRYRKRLIRSPLIITANVTDIKEFEYRYSQSPVQGIPRIDIEYEITCCNLDKEYVSDRFSRNDFVVGDSIKVMIDAKKDDNYCVLYSNKLEREAERFMRRNFFLKFIDYVYDLIM